MYFLSKLAKTIDLLNRIAQKRQDEELKAVVDDLYKQLTIIVNLLEKIYSIYTELDILMKTDLRLDQAPLEDPPQGERLADYVARLASEGKDPSKTLAYLLGAGLAVLQVKNGEVYIDQR